MFFVPFGAVLWLGIETSLVIQRGTVETNPTGVRQQSRFDSREKHIRVDEKEKSFKKDLRKRDLGKRNYKSGEEEQEVEKKNKKWRRRTRSGEEQ